MQSSGGSGSRIQGSGLRDCLLGPGFWPEGFDRNQT